MKTTSPDPLPGPGRDGRVHARRAGGHARRKLVAARPRRAGRDPGSGGGGRQPLLRHRRRGAAQQQVWVLRGAVVDGRLVEHSRSVLRGAADSPPTRNRPTRPTSSPAHRDGAARSAACSTRAASSRSSSRCAPRPHDAVAGHGRQCSAEQAVDRHAAAGAADGTPVSQRLSRSPARRDSCSEAGAFEARVKSTTFNGGGRFPRACAHTEITRCLLSRQILAPERRTVLVALARSEPPAARPSAALPRHPSIPPSRKPLPLSSTPLRPPRLRFPSVPAAAAQRTSVLRCLFDTRESAMRRPGPRVDRRARARTPFSHQPG